MELNKLQTRTLQAAPVLREGEESRTIEGVAVVTNQETTLYECREFREIEVIDQSCIDPDFIKQQDIKLNMFHNRETTLARTRQGVGNLTVDTREDGLHIAFDAPTYDLGERALQMVRDGVISGMSFEFFPKDYEISEREGKDGKLEYVLRHKSFDSITAVTLALDPAYQQTSVNARELYNEAHAEELKEKENREADEAAKKAEEERKLRERQRRMAQLEHEMEYLRLQH